MDQAAAKHLKLRGAQGTVNTRETEEAPAKLHPKRPRHAESGREHVGGVAALVDLGMQGPK